MTQNITSGGGRATAMIVDLSSLESVKTFSNSLNEKFGEFTILHLSLPPLSTTAIAALCLQLSSLSLLASARALPSALLAL